MWHIAMNPDSLCSESSDLGGDLLCHDSDTNPSTDTSDNSKSDSTLVHMPLSSSGSRCSKWSYKCFKKWCRGTADDPRFNTVVVMAVMLNGLALLPERPASHNRGQRDLISYTVLTSIVFNIVFSVVTSIEIGAFGLITGEKAYLRDMWKRIDFLILLSSWSAFGLICSGETTAVSVGFAKVLRILSTLRPVRIIPRVPSVKRTMHMLYASVRPIGNVLIMCGVFFIIFAIWGVQLYRGQLSFCEPGANVTTSASPSDTVFYDAVPTSDARCSYAGGTWDGVVCSVSPFKIVTKRDCEVFGGAWKNRQYNFDNLANAIVTLFVVSSLDGWVEIMRTCIDAVGPDLQPVRDYNRFAVFYFVSFLMIVAYFVISMFVGVIVENFQLGSAVREPNQKSEEKTEPDSREFAFTQQSPRPNGRIRARVYNVVTHQHFRSASSLIIVLNMVVMASEHHGQSDTVDRVIRYLNLCFTCWYVIEELLKCVGIGATHYWRNGWNRAELVITTLAVVGTVFDFVDKSDDSVWNVVLVARLFRVMSIFKVMKSAPALTSLLLATRASAKHVLNLSVLLFVLFFLSASLGTELFGHIDCSAATPCKGLSNKSNFSSIGMAFLVLFQVATGDNWSVVMEDTLRSNPGCDSSFSCSENCCGGTWVPPLFFALFVVLAQLIMLNVVVAVLMKNLGEAVRECQLKKKANSLKRRSRKKKNQVGPEQPVENDGPSDKGANKKPLLVPINPESKATSLLVKLQDRTEKLNESCRNDGSGEAHSTTRHRHALKASLHLVLAMVHLNQTPLNRRVSKRGRRMSRWTHPGQPAQVHHIPQVPDIQQDTNTTSSHNPN